MDLLLATRNTNKTREFRDLLGPAFKVVDLSAFPEIAPIEETGSTFEENARLKSVGTARCAVRISQRDVPTYIVADDSGLEVDALNGAPGIFSARYSGERATDKMNVDKLLGELSRHNVPLDKRSARFRCVIALAENGELLGTFHGGAEGMIVEYPRGDNGFGYDPVFLPNGFDRTFGEMSPQLKNQVSHRAKAITALREFLRRRETDCERRS
jgi:XTP/dITP diphosphohydrolase